MNAQFHTPSFGDEVVFDLADDSNAVNQQHPPQQQQQHMHSKRMRSFDQSLDEYHTANDESFETAAQINNTSPNTSTYICTTPTTGTTTTTTLAARKQLSTPTTDPNEPAKPLSAYALFFRDTVSAIKQQNPKCSFQELSRIVASMWEALDATHKNVYNKKNELARNEYIKQMHLYRQQQEKKQHDEMLGSPAAAATTNDLNGAALQTKPAVFTITRCGSNSAETTHTTITNNFANQTMTPPTAPQQQQQQQMATFTSPSSQQQQQQQQLNITPQQLNNNTCFNSPPTPSTTTTNNLSTTATIDTTIDPSQQQIEMLTEAGSAQKCTRDNCNKRAIINPDWEDEYCSNECVVIHCRNVFNAWVQSNLESRKQ